MSGSNQNNPKAAGKQGAETASSQEERQEERVAINGFNQVLEMLKVADPAFRESLLRRIAAKDRNLARTLREDLSYLGL